MNTAALSRNPSRLTATLDAVERLAALFTRRVGSRSKIGKDRRALQAVPDYLLTDIGLERLEIRTTSGYHDVWISPRRF